MRIEIYGRALCPACEEVTDFLDFQGVVYDYYDAEHVDRNELTYLLTKRTKKTTVPIIFIEGREIDGIDELRENFRDFNQPSTGTLGSSRISKEG